MFLGITAWFSLVSLATSVIVPFEDCGSLYHLESVDIAGCKSYPCHLTTGSAYDVITTVADPKMTAIQNLSNVVYFEVNKILLSAGVAPNSCLKNNNKTKYRALLTVNSTLPPLPATLYWTLKSCEGLTMVCYKIRVVLSPRSIDKQDFQECPTSMNVTII